MTYYLVKGLKKTSLILALLLYPLLINAQVTKSFDEFTGRVEYRYEQPINIPFEDTGSKANFFAEYIKDVSDEYEILFFSSVLSLEDAYFLIDGQRFQCNLRWQIGPYDRLESYDTYLDKRIEEQKKETGEKYPFIKPGEKIYSCKLHKTNFKQIALNLLHFGGHPVKP